MEFIHVSFLFYTRTSPKNKTGVAKSSVDVADEAKMKVKHTKIGSLKVLTTTGNILGNILTMWHRKSERQ